ncbi:MAG TPA: alpha/beta hydrolase [Polyangiales bacterium]|nr:alpha/beta hydrolase [Polyangiales bacterium]
MPTFERDGTSIYYEVHGEGFPLLLFAPGSVGSAISVWSRAAYDPIREFAADFRVIALDQRNAGQSRAPIRASDGWHVYTEDHLALLDHLGVERAHLLGNCVGPSFALALLAAAPERGAAAVLQQPIGATEENGPLFRSSFDSWASELAPHHPEASAQDFVAFRERMFGGDFVFSISRDAARKIRNPMLVLAGNDVHHPALTSRELASLAPNAELVEGWKDPAVLPQSIRRVRAFLQQHTPR